MFDIKLFTYVNDPRFPSILVNCWTVYSCSAGGVIYSSKLPHLFERFYQGHSDRQAKGSGLGLYLTCQLVEAHGGEIWAENRVPNGAIFAFRLPVLPFPLSV